MEHEVRFSDLGALTAVAVLVDGVRFREYPPEDVGRTDSGSPYVYGFRDAVAERQPCPPGGQAAAEQYWLGALDGAEWAWQRARAA